MFLHTLTDTQQMAFLRLARQFIEADSTLSDEEHNLLELMMAEMGVGPDTEITGGDLDELLAAFDTRQARSAALLELIGVGHADSKFSPEENEFVQKAAGAFGVSPEEVHRMDDWVQRQLALAQEVETFWADKAA